MSEAFKPNLVITGMMGTGKSSVARLVSRALNRPLIDTDDEIEKRFQKSVARIFQEDGEHVFRKAEAELCEALSQTQGLVIATGGGTLVSLRSQRLMDRHLVFRLHASLEQMLQRTRNFEKRPLLARDPSDRAASLKTICNERECAYQRFFHQVDTNHLSSAEVCDDIVMRYQTWSEDERMRLVRMPQMVPYAIVVKDGLLGELGSRLRGVGIKANRILLFTNQTLHTLYQSQIEKACSQAQLHFEIVLVPDGESHKNLATVEMLYKKLLALNAKRDDVIVAFGGGVVGDIAGFVAATYMRGLALVQVPTTLLAMVDSSIGGKTGVDLPQGKNLVGAFKQPLMVLCDPLLLKTLPKDEHSAGMAELIKHAIIADASLFERLESGAEIDPATLVFRALQVKADIVEDDPFEQGNRALLNLGHTFGHAIEKVSRYQILHGHAVAIGMVMACELAVQLGMAKTSLKSRVLPLLQRFDLPTSVEGLDTVELIAAMQHDKKGALRFVVPCDIGDVRVVKLEDEKPLRSVIEKAKNKSSAQ